MTSEHVYLPLAGVDEGFTYEDGSRCLVWLPLEHIELSDQQPLANREIFVPKLKRKIEESKLIGDNSIAQDMLTTVGDAFLHSITHTSTDTDAVSLPTPDA